jgi:TolA-binding protein
MMAIGVAVLALLGYAAYWLYTDRRDAAAAALLASSHDANGYQQVITRFDGTNSGATAYLLLAEAQRTAGNYAESNTTLQKFIDKHPKHELVSTGRVGIAANLQSLGRNDEALAMYQRVAADYPKSYSAPLALISQVSILKTKGQHDAARRICETILTQYRESIWANEAMQQLRTLKPATSSSPAPGLPGGPALGGQNTTPPPMLARPPAAVSPGGPPPAAAAPSAAPKAKPPGTKP